MPNPPSKRSREAWPVDRCGNCGHAFYKHHAVYVQGTVGPVPMVCSDQTCIADTPVPDVEFPTLGPIQQLCGCPGYDQVFHG